MPPVIGMLSIASTQIRHRIDAHQETQADNRKSDKHADAIDDDAHNDCVADRDKIAGHCGLAGAMKTLVLLAILFAGWAKSAQLPLHEWLPDAMSAPTPISAYLHAAALVKVGVYIFARALFAAGTVSDVVGWVGTVMAVATMVYGFLLYLPQTDMKRLLAYSTITQVANIFLGLSVSVFGSQLAFNGAIAHIFNHAFGDFGCF